MTDTAATKPDFVLSKPDGHNPDGHNNAGPNWLSRLRVRFGLEDEAPSIRETIEHALQSEDPSKTVFSPQERSMLLNILRFGALRVEDVMVPRADIISIDEQAPLGELLCVFEKAGHSRVPVYRETLDDPTGMVHIKDLMEWITSEAATKQNTASQNGRLDTEAVDLQCVDLTQPVASAKIRRNVLFVPPSMPVVDLLLRMQTTRVHLALVVDEYGGTDGLVSIEDLVEEIVGEIEDEHDVNGEPLIREDSTHGLVAHARTPIGDLEELLGVSLTLPERDDDEVDTLGGLVFSMVGRVPARGELLRHPGGIEFEVMDADPRRIKTLKIHTKPTQNVKARPGHSKPKVLRAS